MIRAEEQQLSLGFRIENSGPPYSGLALIEGHADVQKDIGYVPSDPRINEELRRQQSRLEARADPGIVEQLRAVPLDLLGKNLRFFMLWSPSEGTSDRELRERFSKGKKGGLPIPNYSGLNHSDLRGHFKEYALALRVVARERCPGDLKGIQEEQRRLQYIR